jgi:2-amino-4-deoxychorismate synthase
VIELNAILADQPPAFAIIYRPTVSGDGTAEVLLGRATAHRELTDVTTDNGRETLLLVPFRQIIERGFTVVDDDAELLAIQIEERSSVHVADLLEHLPNETVLLEDGAYETDSDVYVRQVREIIAEEIGRGEGSNFVIKRSFTGELADYNLRTALTLFRRLLETENSAYWTFIVSAGDRVLVGASPERHLSCADGLAVMNPISGTYRYPQAGPDVEGLLEFLADHKETDELNMVVDEELKMMSRICENGAWVRGPFLREMSHLAHTEYYIQGRTSRPPIDLLRETMFAPTVVGSPIENAFRVIARRERSGRGYYSGCVALIGHGHDGQPALDSAIVIRTAEIDTKGQIDICVGATLVRSSDPLTEVAELEAKLAGLLTVLAEPTTPQRKSAASRQGLAKQPSVATALADRNSLLAPFWFTPDGHRRQPSPGLRDSRVLILDGEDAFTSMLACQLDSLGLQVTVRDVRDAALRPKHLSGYELVVLGPGPGDPRDLTDPKIARMHELLGHVRDIGLPLLAICLGHQVLCLNLGLQVARLDVTNQGQQREIDLFGTQRNVGFYNTFVGVSPSDRFQAGRAVVEASRDAQRGHVHALRAPGVRSMQFHPESILTQHGIDVLGECVSSLVTAGQKGLQPW